MSWISDSLSSSLGKKLLMAFSGLFLVIFLVGHLAGNLQLLMTDGQLQFNAYAKFMTSNPAVKLLSYLTYISIIAHAVYALILTQVNNKARSEKYAYPLKTTGSSSTAARNMGILGTIILLFIVLHMKQFWFEMHWGGIPTDSAGNKDLYTVVVEAYKQWWYVLIYVISMGVLAFHLSHGFSSAFQTLGLNHKKYTPAIQKAGLAFSIVVPALFAIIPIFLFIMNQ